MLPRNLYENEKFTDLMMDAFRYSGLKFCDIYLLILGVFWAMFLFVLPFSIMTLEVIEYGNHVFGSGTFDFGLDEWRQETFQPITGLLQLSLIMFVMTVFAIEFFWVSKFLWMVPTALVHLIIIGAIF